MMRLLLVTRHRSLRPGEAVLIEISAAVASSASGPFGKALIDAGWTAGGVLLVRMTLSATVLLIPTLWIARPLLSDLAENATGILLLGIVGICGTVVCYYHAMSDLQVGVALMVLYTAPVIVLAWLWIRHRERPARSTLFGAVVVLTGLTLMVGALDLGGVSYAGVAWALGGALCVATYYVTTDQVTGSIPPIALACSGMWVAVAAIGALVLSGALPFHVSRAAVDLGGWLVPPVVPLLLVGCVSTVYVYIAGFTAVSVLGARVTAFIALAEPICALGVAWLLLGERPGVVQVLGCGLVVVGVILIRADGSGRLRRGVKADDTTTPFLPDPG